MGHLFLGRMGSGLVDNLVGALVYFGAQFSGMFVAAVLNFAVYFYFDNPRIVDDLEARQQRICLFATCPNENVTNDMVKAIKLTVIFATKRMKFFRGRCS